MCLLKYNEEKNIIFDDEYKIKTNYKINNIGNLIDIYYNVERNTDAICNLKLDIPFEPVRYKLDVMCGLPLILTPYEFSQINIKMPISLLEWATSFNFNIVFSYNNTKELIDYLSQKNNLEIKYKGFILPTELRNKMANSIEIYKFKKEPNDNDLYNKLFIPFNYFGSNNPIHTEILDYNEYCKTRLIELIGDPNSNYFNDFEVNKIQYNDLLNMNDEQLNKDPYEEIYHEFFNNLRDHPIYTLIRNEYINKKYK